MNVLLIDDQAQKGWKQILEISLFENNSIDFSESFATAKEKLENKIYDLIFLDLRLDEDDHNQNDIKKFNGFKIINECIRKDFNSINFPTPVIIFSATNKIWNIDTMIHYGADNYYIKEHPNYSFDSEYSEESFKRLQLMVSDLIKIGIKRREIWFKIKTIQEKLFKIDNGNIKSRLEEKLKIGYGLLFRKTSAVENENLIFNNQTISFIVFWSTLEEIVKDSFKDGWIKNGTNEGKMSDDKWVLKNSSIFIEDLTTMNMGKKEGCIEVGIKYNSSIKCYEAGKIQFEPDSPESKRFTGKINLSLQVYAVLLLYKKWSPSQAKNQFEALNDYRNKIDFIHSTISAIFNESLLKNDEDNNGYNKCLEILDFVNEILK
jgi:CheY-like chemotaxis protein